MYSYLYAVYKIYNILRVQGKFLKKNYTILRVCGCYQRGCLFPRNSSKNLFSTTPLEQLHNCTPWIQDKKWYRLNVSGENLYIGVLKVPREGFDCVFPLVLAFKDDQNIFQKHVHAVWVIRSGYKKRFCKLVKKIRNEN